MPQPLPLLTRVMLVACALLFIQGDGQAGDAKPNAGPKGKTNRLARETSPYLLLHAHNPVDWYPWGPEAFAKAVAENKPIFLSIGYSACYWCHVMERESFTDPEIAKALNENFVAIKVDREERPDVDQVYMAALLTTGRGGWPMSMFLTPDGRPFYGGTYFPPRDREPYGGFLPLIHEISRAWKSTRRHAEIEKSANTLTAAARARLEADGRSTAVPLTHTPAAEGLIQLAQQFDPLHGGFGFDPQNYKRPKFPEPSNLVFLLDQQVRLTAERARLAAEKSLKGGAAGKAGEAMALKIEPKKPAANGTQGESNGEKDGDKDKDKDKTKDNDKVTDKDKDQNTASNSPDPIDPLAMALLTLDHMARGGIRDRLAGGYHRYSTERSWSVPHFEKMLYDNAQLASVHLAAFAITNDPRWRHEAEATFQFVERRMTSADGAFYSAMDAETAGDEGGYYVWTPEQVKAVLGTGPDTDAFLRVYGLSGPSNFAGERYVLREPLPIADQATALKTTPDDLEARLAPLKLRLLAARDRRPAPLVDDKILTAWNGLMIAAYADGYRHLGNERYRKAAETAARFVLTRMRNPAGGLLRTHRAGVAKIPAYLDDYAFMIHGLLKLHEATHEQKWLIDARTLTDIMLTDFEDPKLGGFFFTSTGHDTLLARAKDPADNVLPSGNSMAILDLVALSRFTGATNYLDHARKALDAFSGPLTRSPAMVPAMLVGLERYLDIRPPAKASGSAGLAVSPRRQAEPEVVTAVASIDKPSTTFAPGSELLISINVDIANNWHIYGNPPGVVDLKPTTVELDRSSAALARVLAVGYPAGQPTKLGSLGNENVALYSAKLAFPVHVKLASPLEPGNVKLKFLVHYQACNDRLCLAPATLEVPVEVRVGR